MKVNAMMTYTLSPVHTDAYYVERTRELVALGVGFHLDQGSDRTAYARARAYAVSRGGAGRRNDPRSAAFALPVGSRARGVRDRDAKRLSLRLHGDASRSPTARRCRRPRTSRSAHAALGVRDDDERRRARRGRRLFRLALRARRQASRRGRDVRSRAVRAPDPGRNDLQPALPAADDAARAPPARDPGGSCARATRPRIPDRRQPVRAVHRDAGDAERRAGRALRDDPRRDPQVCEGLLRPARGAAVGRIPRARPTSIRPNT